MISPPFSPSPPSKGEGLCPIERPVDGHRTKLGGCRGVWGCYFFEASYDSIVLVCMTQDVSPFCQYSLLVVMVRVALQEVAQSATTANVVRPQARLAVRPALPVRPRPMPLLDCFFIIVFLFSMFIVPDAIERSLYVHSAALYAAFLRPFPRHCMPVFSW